MISRFIKIICLVPIVFIGVTGNRFAQEYFSRQLKYANNLYNSELYFDAVTEYKRLLYFDKYHEYTHEANYKIGMSYKFGGKYDNAIIFLRKAEISARNDEEVYKSKIQIVRCNILRRSTNNAQDFLDKLESDSRFTSKLADIKYWRGWAFMMTDDWQNAAAVFTELDPGHPLKKLANQVENEKYSVTFAKVISYILPGSGQIYTGHYLSGIMSLGWNAVLGYLTINAFVEDRVFDGLVIGNLLWLRFYRGNFENAGNFAENENIKIANDAYRFLKNNYAGDKP